MAISGQKSRWIAALQAFLVGQSLLQVLNAVTGLLLVRWMPVEAYAQYTLANAFQVGAQQFVEFGLGGALVALVGSDTTNRERLGRLVAAGMGLRRKMVWIVGTVAVIVFPVWFASKGWPLGTGLFLTLTILGYIVASGLQVYYSPPLAIHRELGAIYRISIASSAARLAANAATHFAGLLSAPAVSFLNLATYAASGWRLKKASRRHLVPPSGPVESERRELLDYARPILPGVVFAAFQNQVSVFVAALFGAGETIAEVGALGRLALILSLLSAANGQLIAPFIARQPRSLLQGRYLLVVALATFAALGIFGAVWLFPGFFLSLLGPNYSDVGSALLLMVAGSSIGYLNGVLWTLNSSRKWIFSWMPWVSIPGTLAIQAACVMHFDMSTSEGVFAMGLIVSVFILLTRVLVAIRGFRFP